ncbi:MAG TPA: diol dehydratase small subunit [Roseiflexaceae bacterium]|jgi:propanediol dehydratase small subunit
MNERYPLIDHAAERLRAASERPLAEITLDAAADGALSIEDLQIHADTLRAQAEIARAAGYRQLAANLTRAAELARVPNDEVLRVYELLRPGRASFAELIALAELLERRYDARETAGLVREAASVYQSRGLARR